MARKNEFKNNTESDIPVDNLLKPVIFLIRQMDGNVIGKITLTGEDSKSYRESNSDKQSEARIGLSSDISLRYKIDCYVTEIINIDNG